MTPAQHRRTIAAARAAYEDAKASLADHDEQREPLVLAYRTTARDLRTAELAAKADKLPATVREALLAEQWTAKQRGLLLRRRLATTSYGWCAALTRDGRDLRDYLLAASEGTAP